MRFSDLVHLAAGNLARSRSRTAFTLAGVTVGAAALFALLSYGAGLQKLAEDEFAALDLYNALRVTSMPDPVAAFADVEAREIDRSRALIKQVPLTDSVIARLAALPGVLAAYAEMSFPVRLQANRREVVASAEAIPPAFADLPTYRPTAGEFFRSPADSAVLFSPSMARRLGFDPAERAIGETVRLVTSTLDFEALAGSMVAFALGQRALPLRNHVTELTVVGLLHEDGQAVTSYVRAVLPVALADSIPKIAFFSTVELLSRGADTGGYPSARVQLESDEYYEEVSAAIEAEGLFVAGYRDRFAQFKRLFTILDGSLLVVGLIALLVATIGIANTMAMSVVERRREIGVMKAVGAERRVLSRIFLAESALIGTVGVVLGLAVGWAATAALDALVDVWIARLGVAPVQVFHSPLWMVAGILLVTIAVSVLAGVAPARRAARVDPVAALRGM